MSRGGNSTLFDVDDSSTQPLAFQDFGSATIASDIPSGRISPGGGSSSAAATGGGGPSNLYEAEQRFEQRLNGATKSGGFLNLDFYTGYFDVDTITVLTRCAKTFLPKEDYINEVLSGVPDLYGPFWIPTTLIFSLFLISSFSASVSAYLAGDKYTYDFTRLGAAVSLVYMYCLGLPFLVWAALKYWAGSTERTAVEIVSLYGYQATIWIVTAWLTLIPYAPLRAVLVLSATVLSGAFLIRNLYPVIAQAPNVSSRLLIIVIIVLHLILAIAMWVGFLADGSGILHHDPMSDSPILKNPVGGEGKVPGSGSGSNQGSDLPPPGGDAGGLGARAFF